MRCDSGLLLCDCADAARGKGCKHRMAVGLATGDKTLHAAVRRLNMSAPNSELDIFDLWFDKSLASSISAS